MSGICMPDDILLQIFSRLPAKSVGQFRCLSSPWCTALSTPSFIKSHLNLLIKNQETNTRKFVLFDTNNGNVDKFADFNKQELVELNHPLKSDYGKCGILVVGSCRGLLCLYYFATTNIYIWNPCTTEYKALPSSFTFQPPGKLWDFNSTLGFGYKSRTEDYQVVRITLLNSDPTNLKSVVHIYSLATNSERRIGEIPYQVYVKGRVVKGYLHWLAAAQENRNLVLAFDFEEETFRELALPIVVDNVPVAFLPDEFDGKLCIRRHHSNKGIELWLMREYGVRESWNKLFNIITSDYSVYVRPICYDDNGWVFV